MYVRNCGFLSWDRIYFQDCHWSIQFKILFLHSHWRKQCTDIQGERKRVDQGLKLKVSTVDIQIK